MGPSLQLRNRSLARAAITSHPAVEKRFGCCKAPRAAAVPQVLGKSLAFGRGPPLQGDFVRRVVARPAPTRGRGTSMYRSDEIPLQRRPSPRWVSWFRWATATATALTSGGAAAVRGSGASPGCAIHGSNRRAQAIHGLLAPDPRTTATFATCMSVASLKPAPAGRRQWLAEAGNTTVAKDVAARGFRPSGTWMYRARVLEQDAEPRGGREPLAAAAPTRSKAFALAEADPCPPGRESTIEKPRRSGVFRGYAGTAGQNFQFTDAARMSPPTS